QDLRTPTTIPGTNTLTVAIPSGHPLMPMDTPIVGITVRENGR
ncbi:unnamed protein product, partial [marine sediment metagenome]